MVVGELLREMKGKMMFWGGYKKKNRRKENEKGE